MRVHLEKPDGILTWPFGFLQPPQSFGMSTVGSLGLLSRWQVGFYNPHAVGAGRLAPLSHDSLVATSCSLMNFSRRAFSGWVHMDPTCGSHLALSLSLLPLPPGFPFSSPRSWELTPCPESIIFLFKLYKGFIYICCCLSLALVQIQICL